MEHKESNQSIKEKRIRDLTHLYYSRKDIQKLIFNFSPKREVVPRYFEGFGKRPDSLQYPGDVFEMVKKGATSFHCSEELWSDPLRLSTEMDEKKIKSLREGWDLLLDIDSKYLDYSKVLVEIIIEILNFYGIKNIGLKFSGSKGFHILVPCKSFPSEINNVNTAEMFPEWPRIVTQFIMESSKKKLIEKITFLLKGDVSKYVKDFEAPKEVMPDLILVSPRHLFRMPYSLHEKTALSSVVLDLDELKDFQPMKANPLKVKLKDFMPNSKEGEASELLREALDWHKNKNPGEDWTKGSSNKKFTPIKVSTISEDILPPSIKKLLKGMKDGRKRALFILLNFFRAIDIDKEEIEKIIYSWNKKNEVPLKEGYIKTQISWSYRNKVVPPPNYDKDYYKGLGINPTEEEILYKNTIKYIFKKNLDKTKIKNKKSN